MYGVEPDSKYIKADLGDGVYISTAYADKYQVEPGDKITLKEKYERKRYTFKVKGVYDYSGAISVFMSRDKLNETFDLGSDYYAGYFANTKIKDIDGKYIGSVVDLEALTKVSRQLDVSMGNIDGTGQWICDHDLYDCHLSVVKDHYREKCAVHFHDEDPWIYQRRDQQVVYYVNHGCSCNRTAIKSSD